MTKQDQKNKSMKAPDPRDFESPEAWQKAYQEYFNISNSELDQNG